jgi:uncharacterized repeat protein (TIGR01451 family)
MRIVENETLRLARILLISSILLGALGAGVAPASADEHGCYDGQQDSGALYRICMPQEGEWNGDLMVYAHGYVAPDQPIAIPEDQLVLPDGTSIPDMITDLGFAFATTSYSTNGLAVQEGMADLADLVGIFSSEEVTPTHVYLTGASEGGLIAALSTEQHDDVFDGGLAACGPVGDFRRQLNYWGDVRVLFDYFFPGVLPPFTPDQDPPIPQDVMDNWEAYEADIRAALDADPEATRQLLRVARVPLKRGDDQANVDALVQLLWYNVFATNDGVAKVGGQPYDNNPRWYWGSDDDWQLNQGVARFDADQAALDEIADNYQTAGALSVPIVTLHTLKDPVVPYWHEPIYRWKVSSQRSQALHINIPSLRYGHCSFGAGEALFALALLTYQVGGFVPSNVADVLTPAQYADYASMAAEYGLDPGSDQTVPSTLERDLDPVVVSGTDLPDLQAAPTDELFVYAHRNDSLEQIPFQVDEVDSGAYTDTLGGPLDGDDEVVFMASDLGGQPADEGQIGATLPISPTWYRIEVSDPMSPTLKGWAYVVRSSSLTRTFTETYTTYDAVNNRIVTPRYAVGFASDFPGLDYLALNESGVDILDRTKIRITVPILGTLDENEIVAYIDFEPITAIKEGPVRVLATGGIVGYRSILETATVQEIPPIIFPQRARFSTDYTANAGGSTFYDANTPAGVPVDGNPDAIAETPLSPWSQVSGATGTLVQVTDGSGLGGTQSNYYKDDATVDPDDTGDERSYADVGIKVESPNQTIDYRTTLYVLPPDQENVGATYEAHYDHPLQAMTTEVYASSVNVDKTGPALSRAGETIMYTVSVRNTSPADAPDLILDAVDDTLVGDLESVAAANACDTLAPDGTCSFTYVYTVQSDDPDPLPNTVEVHYHPQSSTSDVTDSDEHDVALSGHVVYLPLVLRH